MSSFSAHWHLLFDLSSSSSNFFFFSRLFRKSIFDSVGHAPNFGPLSAAANFHPPAQLSPGASFAGPVPGLQPFNMPPLFGHRTGHAPLPPLGPHFHGQRPLGPSSSDTSRTQPATFYNVQTAYHVQSNQGGGGPQKSATYVNNNGNQQIWRQNGPPSDTDMMAVEQQAQFARRLRPIVPQMPSFPIFPMPFSGGPFGGPIVPYPYGSGGDFMRPAFPPSPYHQHAVDIGDTGLPHLNHPLVGGPAELPNADHHLDHFQAHSGHLGHKQIAVATTAGDPNQAKRRRHSERKATKKEAKFGYRLAKKLPVPAGGSAVAYHSQDTVRREKSSDTVQQFAWDDTISRPMVVPYPQPPHPHHPANLNHHLAIFPK